MDKETLIRLATPASITLLALSIFSIPLIAHASGYVYGDIALTHKNSCT